MSNRLHGVMLLVAVAVAGAAFSGCQLAYFLTPEQKKPVEAEYNKIKNQRVAVVVWAEQATLDVNPTARCRVCKAVTYELRQHLKEAKFVDCDEVDALQQDRKSDWESMPHHELCKRLKCDLVMKIDLADYTTRATETRELRKGRIRGTIKIYSDDEYGKNDALYNGEVLATFPPDSSRGVIDADDATVLRETEDQFAQAVARKFYDYEESYKKTGEKDDE